MRDPPEKTSRWHCNREHGDSYISNEVQMPAVIWPHSCFIQQTFTLISPSPLIAYYRQALAAGKIYSCVLSMHTWKWIADTLEKKAICKAQCKNLCTTKNTEISGRALQPFLPHFGNLSISKEGNSELSYKLWN